jgi:hypothetical protein
MKKMCQLLCYLVVTCMTISITACGGFLKVTNENMPSFGDGVKDQNDKYVSASVYLRNSNTLLSDLFTKDRANKIKLLYISTKFTHPVLAPTGKNVPLYMLNLDNGSLTESQGAQLIAKLPIDPNSAITGVLTFETHAVEKANVDGAMGIFKIASGIIGQAGIANAGLSTSLTLVDSAASQLDKMSVSDRTYSLNVVAPDIIKKKQFLIYCILPTDSQGRILPKATDLAKNMLAYKILPKSDGGYLSKDDNDYTDLPYLVIDYTISDYVSDTSYLPKDISSTCGEITLQTVNDAENSLNSAGYLLSSEQKAQEVTLTAKGRRLCELVSAVTSRNDANSVDAYDAYMSIFSNTGSYYNKYYTNSHAALDKCADNTLRNVPGYDRITAVTKACGKGNVNSLSSREIESLIFDLKVFTDQSLNIPGQEYLLQTRLFQKAAGRKLTAETALMFKEFKPKIEKIKQAKSRSTETDKVADDLTKMAETSCVTCRNEALAAVSEYWNKFAAVAEAKVQQEKIGLLLQVTKLRDMADADNKKGLSDNFKVLLSNIRSAQSIADLNQIRPDMSPK